MLKTMTNTYPLRLRILMARKQKRLSQEQLAALLQVGRSAVANWECGKAVPKTRNLHSLAGHLDVSFDWLATGHGPMRAPQDTPVAVADMGTAITDDEQLLLQAFRHLPKRQQHHIARSLAAIAAVSAMALEDLLPYIGG